MGLLDRLSAIKVAITLQELALVNVVTTFVCDSIAAAATTTVLAVPTVGSRWILADLWVQTSGRGIRLVTGPTAVRIFPDTAADTFYFGAGVWHPRQSVVLEVDQQLDVVTDASAGTVVVYCQAIESTL